MKNFFKYFTTVLLTLSFAVPICAREVQQRELPMPDTISPELRALVEPGITPWWDTHPTDDASWKEFVEQVAKVNSALVPPLLKELKVTSKADAMAGVPVFMLQPETVPEQNRDRILLALHGGGYVLGPGESGAIEGIYMAGIGGFKVVSVDYRRAPEHPYPAALDDALAVYKELLKQYPSTHIGIFGTSTGGGMTLALAMRVRDEGLPMPGALVAGTPWTDLSKTGDSYFANEYVDNVLVSYDGWLKDAAMAYAKGHDLKDPYISPVYGDIKNMPPTLLVTGTRDLFLSNTARMHQKLREGGIIADLLVLEGVSHAQYMMLPPAAREALFYFGEATKFFDRYLK